MNLGDGTYFLKFNDFSTNAGLTFQEMRNDFTDVTLACDDNHQVVAHKVILAAASSFFSEILKANRHPHPLIYLRGVKGRCLDSVLDFIYHGEVNIEKEHLEEFLQFGGELQIKGLDASHESTDIGLKTTATNNEANPKKLKIEPTSEDLILFAEQADEKCVSNISINSVRTLHSLDKEIDSLLQKAENNGFVCKVCGIEMNTKQKMRDHVEGHHIDGFSLTCNTCKDGKSYKTRHSLSVHQSKYHRH